MYLTHITKDRIVFWPTDSSDKQYIQVIRKNKVMVPKSK